MEASNELTPGAGWSRTSHPRSVGRPSLVVRYTPRVMQWLVEDPNLTTAEILKRVRLEDYRGGKSALYELVRRLRGRRPDRPGEKPAADQAETHRGAAR